MTNARVEELVRNLAALLAKWRLASLVLCLNQPFVDQSLIDCIGTQLTRLHTLCIELGQRRNSVHITRLMPLVLSRVRTLHLGPVLQPEQLIPLADAFRNNRCSVQCWSMSYDSDIFFEPDHELNQNPAFDHSMRKLRFTYYEGDFNVLQQITIRFVSITHLELQIVPLAQLHFGVLVYNVWHLSELKSLKISAPYLPPLPFDHSLIQLPERWWWGTHRQPVIASKRLHTLEQLQINIGDTRAVYQLTANRLARYADLVANIYNSRIECHLRDHCPAWAVPRREYSRESHFLSQSSAARYTTSGMHTPCRAHLSHHRFLHASRSLLILIRVFLDLLLEFVKLFQVVSFISIQLK